MSSALIKKKIRRRERRRTRLLAELINVRLMLRGSFAIVKTRCGKPTCWCAGQAGHLHPRLTWSEQGRPLTRKVPHNQIVWVRKVTEAYRRFRGLRREIKTLEGEIRHLLDELETALTNEAREGKDFLAARMPQIRKPTGQKVPKMR